MVRQVYLNDEELRLLSIAAACWDGWISGGTISDDEFQTLRRAAAKLRGARGA